MKCFIFTKPFFLKKHMKNSHVLQLLEHMDAGPYAFVILEFVILDFYRELGAVLQTYLLRCNHKVNKLLYCAV